jgi:hypothetical protein
MKQLLSKAQVLAQRTSAMSEYQSAAAAEKDMFDSTFKTTSSMSPDNATPPVLEDTTAQSAVLELKHVLENNLHQHHADLQVGTAMPQSRSCSALMSLVAHTFHALKGTMP